MVALSLVAVGAFALYWLSGVALEMRHALPYFGADTWYYVKLAEPNVLNGSPRITSSTGSPGFIRPPSPWRLRG